MGAAAQRIDNKVLRGFVPLDGLSPHNFNAVVSRLQIRQVEKGGYIFKEGDRDPNTLYLIEGKVELQQNGKKISVMRAGSHDAMHPLSPQQPRLNGALAKTRVTVAFIDKTLLDAYVSTHQESAYEVCDISADDDDDWMTRLLQSDTFSRLPPMNIQRMLTRMQAVPLKANDIVLSEGDDGDAYYTIKRGRCRVSRRGDDGREKVLAELADGACFGEDALLSESKRSATITMLTDGELMRLSKKDFLELLNDPLVDTIAYAEAIELIDQGAKWLDTRSSTEHNTQRISDSINIPIPELRNKLKFLDKNTTYITYCNDGRTSSAATFVLRQYGINSRALSNGMVSADISLVTVNSGTQANDEPNTQVKLENDKSNDTESNSAEIIGFEEPLGAKHIAQIKQLRSELNKLRELSATRLKHTKLQAHEQIEKLQNELKQSHSSESELRDHNKNEVKQLKTALYEEQENAASISTSKLETEQTLTTLIEQVAKLKEQDTQQKNKLKSSQEKMTTFEQIKIDATNTISELRTQLEKTRQDKDQSENLPQKQIAQLEEKLREEVDTRSHIEEQLCTTQKTVYALTQNENQASQQVNDRQQEIKHLKNKLEETITAQRQAGQEVSILRGKLEGSKEAQQEVVRKLKQQLKDTSNEHQKISDEGESLHTQLSVAEKQLSDKQNTINNLAADIDKNQSIIETLNKDYDTALSEKIHFRDEIESLKSKFNDTNNKNDTRTKELTLSIEDSHRTNQSLQQDNHELKLKLEDSARETERLQVSISGEIDAEIERLLAEIKIKSAELTQLQSTLKSSTQNTQQIEQKLNNLEHQLKENKIYIATLETDLNTNQDAYNSLEDTTKNLENTQQSLQEKINDYESQLSTLHDVQGNSSELTQRLESLSSENTQLHGNLTTTKEQLQNINEKLDTANSVISSLNVDNDQLQNKLSETEEQLISIKSKLDSAQSNAGNSDEELSELKETISDLEESKNTLAEKLATQVTLQQENSVLQQHIDELEQSKQALLAGLEENESNQAETAQKLKEFEQEKSILIEKISDSEELVVSLRDELENTNDNTEQLKTEIARSDSDAQNTITQLTITLEQTSITHEQQINDLTQQLDRRINDHQKTNSTLDDLHANFRTERLDLETQLYEQRLLKEQADAVANTAKLEIEGTRAELNAANQQLNNANNDDSNITGAEQLQRLSADLAKAVEYRKQSEISKQTLQDDINETRQEVARLKGENDGHLELRIQLEGQLAVLRQQLRSNPVANEIIDNIKNITDSNGIGSIPAITDIGQTVWESPPKKNRSYFIVIAVFTALAFIGTGSWLFRAQLGLEHEWQTIGQQLGLVENTDVTTKKPLTGKTKALTKEKPNRSTVKDTATQNITAENKTLLAVTPTSRDVTPIPFRVYRNALKNGGASPIMVEMPAGNFTMGSSVTSDFFEERPHRDIKVSRFAISKHEISFAEYEKFAKATKHSTPDDEGWGRNNQPVINVSWQDAVDYTVWLSEQTGHSYRLPSESEWEYMARAGSQASYWWGNELRGNYANCHDCTDNLAGKQTTAVESYDANAFGIKNTAGNVAEWVQDCYHASYENAPLDSKAWISNGNCGKRMVRGGSYRSSFNHLRSSARDSFDITTRSDSIGFRVVREY